VISFVATRNGENQELLGNRSGTALR